MKLTLRIISGAVVALSLGTLVILVSLGYSGPISAATKGSGLMPGGPGYVFVQLVVGSVAASIALYCLFGPRTKSIRIAASVLAVVAIAVSLGDVFWLPVLIIVQSGLFIWFQLRTFEPSSRST